ncbi:MAG: glycosyltransferase family 39 protein [Nitrospira sp.]|jgi:hypothetical protein
MLEVGLVAFLASLACWLRYRHLGMLGLYGDEDHSYFAIKGVLETGWPQMPSGMVYPRGLIYTYLAAASALILGLTEEALRMPSVLFSLLTLVLLYVVTRDLRGPIEALVTVSLFSVSTWDIEMARFARMYEIFLFVSLLGAYGFYRGFLKGEKGWRRAVPVLFVLAVTLHTLGVCLLLLFASVFLVRLPGGITRLMAIAYVGAIGAADVIWVKLENIPYANAFEDVLLKKVDSGEGLRLPQIELLRSILETWPANVIFFGVMTVITSVFIVMVKRTTVGGTRISTWLLVTGMVVSAVSHTYVIAAILIAYQIYATGRGLLAVFDKPYWPYYGFIVMTAGLWASWALSAGIHGQVLSPKATIEFLFNYPFVNLRVLGGAFPVMTFLVVVGVVLLFHEASCQAHRASAAFLLVALLGPLLVIGVVRSWPWIGYLYMTYPFFLIIYANTIVQGCQWVMQVISKDQEGPAWPRSVVVTICSLLLAGLFSSGHSLSEARSISDRGYATPVQDIVIFEYLKHPDHKTAALYVRDNKEVGDTVIAMDFLSAAYLGRIDFLLRTEGYLVPGLQLKKEIFLGCPILHDLGELQAVIESQSSGNVWLITSQEHWGPHLKEPIMSRAVIGFLEESHAHVIYVGQDGETRVYKWSRGPSEVGLPKI